MKKVCIFCCTKVTNRLGCSSAQCLYDLKNRTGSFAKYVKRKDIELVGLVNCPGCPTQVAPERMINQIENLIEFQVNAIHFTNCMSTFCVFQDEYKVLIQRNYPEIEVILGMNKLHITQTQQELITKYIPKS